MSKLAFGLLGFAVAGIAFAAITVFLIFSFRRRPAGFGAGTAGSPASLIGTISQNKFARGLGIAIFLTVLYVLLLWLCYSVTVGTLMRELGTEKRWALLLVTVLGLPLIELIWWLYGVTGIPGDPKVIGRSFRILALFVLIFLGWWYYYQPSVYFDAKTGKANFYWAEKESKPYFFDSGKGTVPKVYFSPATGETLRLGTPKEAEKFRKGSWLKKISGYRVTAHAATAGENYTFSPGVDVIRVPLDSVEWSGWIKTPPRSTWRIAPPDSGWAEVWYWDGTRSKIYPDKHVWRGVKYGIFRLRGEGGKAVVTIDRN